MKQHKFIIPSANQAYLNNIASRYGMKLARKSTRLVYDDDKFIVFTSSKDPIFVNAESQTNLSRSIFQSQSFAEEDVVDIKLPNNFTSIDPDAFDGLENLSSLTFPHTTPIKTIQAGTGHLCSKLLVLKLGNGIQTVEEGAFDNVASSFQTLGIPYSIHSFADSFLSNAEDIEIDFTSPSMFTYDESSLSSQDISMLADEDFKSALDGWLGEFLGSRMKYSAFGNQSSSSMSSRRLLGASSQVKHSIEYNGISNGKYNVKATTTIIPTGQDGQYKLVVSGFVEKKVVTYNHVPKSGPYGSCQTHEGHSFMPRQVNVVKTVTFAPFMNKGNLSRFADSFDISTYLDSNMKVQKNLTSAQKSYASKIQKKLQQVEDDAVIEQFHALDNRFDDVMTFGLPCGECGAENVEEAYDQNELSLDAWKESQEVEEVEEEQPQDIDEDTASSLDCLLGGKELDKSGMQECALEVVKQLGDPDFYKFCQQHAVDFTLPVDDVNSSGNRVEQIMRMLAMAYVDSKVCPVSNYIDENGNIDADKADKRYADMQQARNEIKKKINNVVNMMAECLVQ